MAMLVYRRVRKKKYPSPETFPQEPLEMDENGSDDSFSLGEKKSIFRKVYGC